MDEGRALERALFQAHDDMRLGVLITEGERAVYVSDGFLAMTGWSRGDIAALSSVYDLIPEDERASARQRTRELGPEGGVVERSLLRKDGTRIEVEVALRRYSAEGRSRSVAIVRDVTLRKRTLEELERNQRLDSLGSLAGGIAHDFNNLLAVILNNAHLALGQADGNAAARREIEEIRQAAEQGVQLTRQMLVFTRGVRPRSAGPIDPVDVRREATYAERLLRRAIGDGIALDVRISPGLSSARLEPGQLEQILLNLAVNARDAMPEGGRLAIDIDEVQLADATAALMSLPPGRYLRVVVQDGGVGMTPEVARRAFEPFFTTKPKAGGTGLGLSTVYGLVRRAGGNVELASAPGRGARVTIHVPASSGAPERTPSEPARAATSEDGQLDAPVGVA